MGSHFILKEEEGNKVNWIDGVVLRWRARERWIFVVSVWKWWRVKRIEEGVILRGEKICGEGCNFYNKKIKIARILWKWVG